jgi:hypothetical protein
MTIDEARDATGFNPFLPLDMPERFGLYSIQAINNAPPPNQSDSQQLTSLALDYRLLQSLHVPGVLIIETAIPLEESVEVLAESPGCGEELTVGGSPALIAKGGGSLTRGDDPSVWRACGDTFADPIEEEIAPYWLVTVRGNVIIEIKAYPETMVTREQLIAIAESMVPVNASD